MRKYRGFSFKVFPEKRIQPFPLTDQQQAYAFGQSEYGAKLTSKIYTCFEAKRLDVHCLEIAWRKVINDHPMLKNNDYILMAPNKFKNSGSLQIKVHDLRAKSNREVSQ